jgi:U4/U6.U5 tri-snRNP-associated protein 3
VKSEPEVVRAEQKAATNGYKATISDEDDEDALLRTIMGFSTFRSTQNTKVPGNNIYGVRKEKKTEYRQYMNRVGGFNRPLSPTR